MRLSKRPAQAAEAGAEANREAAEAWTKKAREQHEEGDDAKALGHLEKSLKLCETASARSLHDHIRKYGAGSAAAQAVARVLKAADHYEVLNLPRAQAATLTPAELKKAYRQLSLRLHPDRNHARQAEAAFKRLSEAYTFLSSQQAGNQPPTEPTTTPRAEPSASHAAPKAGSASAHQSPHPPPNPPGDHGGEDEQSGDFASPRGPNPVRRRRRWEKALGLGKKRTDRE